MNIFLKAIQEKSSWRNKFSFIELISVYSRSLSGLSGLEVSLSTNDYFE